MKQIKQQVKSWETKKLIQVSFNVCLPSLLQSSAFIYAYDFFQLFKNKYANSG